MNRDLKILKESPVFTDQMRQKNYLPDLSKFKTMIDGIFSRKYYTNHGVLAQNFEKQLSELLDVKHAICMTNTGIGIMIASKALGLQGKVILPGFSHVSIIQAVSWAGLEPVLCDVREFSCDINTDSIEALIDENTCAILGVDMFGGSCDYEKIEEISERYSIKNYFISTDSIGQNYNNKKIGNFGACEIFSLHEENIINSTDGCVITTNDDFLAARLRNIRSSYGSGPKVEIEFTGNGRMSEVQAGIGLLTLDNFDENKKMNRTIYDTYVHFLSDIKGIHVFEPNSKIGDRNFQNLILKVDGSEFGIDAKELSKILEIDNIFVKTLHLYDASACLSEKQANLPITTMLTNSTLALPVKGLKKKDVELICEVIRKIPSNIDEIRLLLKG